MTEIPRGKFIGEKRDFRVCCHHATTPTNHIIYPTGDRLLTWKEAVDRMTSEQDKGYMIAWIIGRNGVAAVKPAEEDHFIKCGTCGGWIDCRDLGQVFEHEGPLPHPVQDQTQ